jgi:hypothetical protein
MGKCEFNLMANEYLGFALLCITNDYQLINWFCENWFPFEWKYWMTLPVTWMKLDSNIIEFNSKF